MHGREEEVSFAQRKAIPDDLLQYCVDRDAGAVPYAGEIALDMRFPVKRICLMHGRCEHRSCYEAYFG